LADRGKFCPNCHNGKHVFFCRNTCIMGPYHGIQIPVRFVSGSFCSDLDPCSSQSIRLRVLAKNPPDLRTLILHLWMCYSIDRSLKRPIFKLKKGFGNLSLGLNYYLYCSMGLSWPQFCDTVPFKIGVYVPSVYWWLK
jgi:hypothetical protein